MIVERVVVHVVSGREDDFEAALRQARDVIAGAEGVGALRFARGIESPSTYLLLIEWDSVEAHMVGFRESERFARWRELIGPFFASPPEVEHFQPLAT
jgi:heme-degrading monooxygenase HmoA